MPQRKEVHALKKYGKQCAFILAIVFVKYLSQEAYWYKPTQQGTRHTKPHTLQLTNIMNTRERGETYALS